MSIQVQDKGRIKSVSSIKVHPKDKAVLRDSYILMMKVGGVLRIVWQKVSGYIFTSDNAALKTEDGYMIKCSDQ